MPTLTPQTIAFIPSGLPADLAAVDLSLLPPGQYNQARVGNTGDWHLFPNSALVADGITVVNAKSGSGTAGRWHRNTNGTPGANLVTQWYVNTSSGADTNDGLTSGTALATVAEVIRRLGDQDILQNVTITVVGNDTHDVSIDSFIATGVTLTIQGTRTVLVSDVIASRTVWATASQVVGSYTFTTTTGSLAAYVGTAFVQVHATPTQISPVVKDLGSGAFRGLFCDTGAAGAQVEPSVSAAVDIYSVNSLSGNVTAAVRGGGTVKFVDLTLCGAGKTCRAALGAVVFQGCLVHTLVVTRSVHDAQLIASEAFDAVANGRLELFGSVCATGTGSVGLVAQSGCGLVQVQTLSLVQGGPLNVGSTTDGTGVVETVAGLAIADPGATAAVTVWPGSLLRAGADLFETTGSALTTAYVIMDGGRIHYASGHKPGAGGTAPTNFATVVGTVKASGAIPYVEATAGLAAFIVDA